MRVAPPSRRSTRRESAGGLEIVIPSRRNFLLLLFLGAWLVAWGVGGVFAIREVISGRQRDHAFFMVAWLVMWAVAAALAAYSWLWTIAGREVVRLGAGALTIREEVFGLGGDREYDLAHVKRLRVVPHVSDPYGWRSTMRWWGVGGGSLAFDYGAKTVQFGAVDEAEGHEIVEELRSRHLFDAA